MSLQPKTLRAIGSAAFTALAFQAACAADDDAASGGSSSRPDTGADASHSSDAAVTGAGSSDAAVRDAASDCVFAGEQEHPHDSSPAQHVEVPLTWQDYDTVPPSSGPHCGQWARYGSYDTALAPCLFVHNLEHGAIVLLYNCPDGCADLIAELEHFFEGPPSDPDCESPRLLLSPYADMPYRVAAAAWGYTWTSDCFDEDARASLGDFIEAHWGSRGDSPEPGICSDGI